MMADRPILFSGPMVRALLEGSKTQTRRIMKPQPELSKNGTWHVFNAYGGTIGLTTERVPLFGPDYVRYEVGDRLWVRETWQGLSFGDYQPTKSRQCEVRFAATDPCADLDTDARGYPWRPSIFMPRWASRLTLIVTDVRVERLQDISEEDAVAEGIYVIPINDDVRSNFYDQDWAKALPDNTIFYSAPDDDDDHCMRLKAVEAYERLWNSINDERGLGWETNPWVVAVTFEVLKQNIDEVRP